MASDEGAVAKLQERADAHEDRLDCITQRSETHAAQIRDLDKGLDELEKVVRKISDSLVRDRAIWDEYERRLSERPTWRVLWSVFHQMYLTASHPRWDGKTTTRTDVCEAALRELRRLQEEQESAARAGSKDGTPCQSRTGGTATAQNAVTASEPTSASKKPTAPCDLDDVSRQQEAISIRYSGASVHVAPQSQASAQSNPAPSRFEAAVAAWEPCVAMGKSRAAGNAMRDAAREEIAALRSVATPAPDPRLTEAEIRAKYGDEADGPWATLAVTQNRAWSKAIRGSWQEAALIALGGIDAIRAARMEQTLPEQQPVAKAPDEPTCPHCKGSRLVKANGSDIWCPACTRNPNGTQATPPMVDARGFRKCRICNRLRNKRWRNA